MTFESWVTLELGMTFELWVMGWGQIDKHTHTHTHTHQYNDLAGPRL